MNLFRLTSFCVARYFIEISSVELCVSMLKSFCLECCQEENNGSGNNRMLPPPCIHRYAAVGRGWKEQGMLSKDASKLVSCIKVEALPVKPLLQRIFAWLLLSMTAVGHISVSRLLVSS